MSKHTFRPPTSKLDLPVSLLLGAAFAIGLFVVMALTQLLGDIELPRKELSEEVVAYTPPEFEEFEEEEPPPPEEEEPPPELEAEPPQLSLEQLDIALNPGTGGSLMGDFSLPVVSASAQSLGTEDFVDFSDLDQLPRPIGVAGLNFPRRLRRKKVSGQIDLFIKLDSNGEVLKAEIASSNLPDFDEFVSGEVGKWRFTPPTRLGRPVRAKARLPIPINIR